MGRYFTAATSRLPRLPRWLTGLADLLLRFEPLWVVPALGFAYTRLLWGLGYWWMGLGLAAAVFALRRYRLGRFSRRTPFDVPCALLLAASVLGVIVSPDRGLSLRAFETVVICVTLYYSLVNIPHRAFLTWGFALCTLAVFVGVVLSFREGLEVPSMVADMARWVQQCLQHLPQVPRFSNIANPPLSTSHGAAIALEMVILPLTGMVAFAARLAGKVLTAGASLVLLLPLLLLGSQGAWLAVSAGVVFLLLWRSRWAAILVVAASGLGYLCYWQGWIDPHSLVSQFGPSHSLSSRVGLWRWSIDVIGDHPVAGCGLGCLGRYSTTSCLSPHNAYLQFYADMGVIGAAALLGALIVGGRMTAELAQTPRRDWLYGLAVGVVAAALAIGLHGLFEGAPAGIIAETADGYYYAVSPVPAILAGLLVVSLRLMRECRGGAEAGM